MSAPVSRLRPGCPRPPVPNRSYLFPPIQTAVAPLFACTADSVFHPAAGVDRGPRENVFLSACTDEGCGSSVVRPLQPRYFARPTGHRTRAHVERLGGGGHGGKRRSWICVNGPKQAARDRKQGRQGRTSKRHGSRVDQRRSPRSRPQGRHGESSPETATTGARRGNAQY